MLKIKKLVKRIAELKKDVVFVGGLSLVHHNIKETTKDIDMVILNLDGLDEFGPFEVYNLPPEISTTRRRAKVYVDNILIDVIIDEKLPDYVEHEGVKYQTLDSMMKFYEDHLPRLKVEYRNKPQASYDLIKEKLNKRNS